MATKGSAVSELETMSKDAMFYMFQLMDDITGGCFKKGYREATAAERIQEWDQLPGQAFDMLREKKGEDWLADQAAQVERLRREMEPK